MSKTQKHDYIGLSESQMMNTATTSSLNLKETELRLGLPGSTSPDRTNNNPSLGLLPLFSGKSSNFVSSGAKRGFSDVTDVDDGSCKWGFGLNGGGSDGDLVKKNGVCQKSCGVDLHAVKEVCVEKKKAQMNEHGNVPAAKAQVVGWPPIRSFRKNTMATSSAKNNDEDEAKLGPECLYVKVSMDGAPYLRKVDLKIYSNYKELSSALEKMFSCFTIGYEDRGLFLYEVREWELAITLWDKLSLLIAMPGCGELSITCGSHGLRGRDGISESSLMDLLHGSESVLTYEDKDGDWMLVGDVPWQMFANSCRRLRIMKGSEAIGLAPRAMEKNKNWN